MLKKTFLLILSITALGLAAGSVQANNIVMEFYNPSPASITCDGADLGVCLGFTGTTGGVGTAALSGTTAEEQLQQGSPNNELAYLNDLLAALNPARAAVVGVNKVDIPGLGFTTSAQYFSIKQANDLFYFENTTGGAITVVVNTPDNNKYSHWTEYGPSAPIPLPAAIWLFGSGLLGLLGVKGNRKKAS